MNNAPGKSIANSSVNAESSNNNSNNNSETCTNEHQNIRRAVRHLRRSGRRLVRREDGWAVMHSGHPVARLNAEEVAFLVAEGHVVEAAGGALIIASATTEEHTSAPDAPPPSGAWVFAAAGCPTPRTPGRGFAKFALKARTGEGPLTLRQAEAGLRLIADAEAAMRRSGLTMDWTNTVTDRQRRHARDGGLSESARAASRRLDRMLNVVGGQSLGLAWRACVERRTIASLAITLGVTRRTIVSRLARALEDIALVYDASG